MILSKQTQFKLLEKKVKGKSDSVVRNLIVLRKFRQGKKYNIFEKELLNDCKYQTQEIYETIRYEGQEDKRIQER